MAEVQKSETTWNPDQYLKFKEQRTRPARDLAARISAVNANQILDVGCGPANSTSVLRDFFPKANLTGIDTSSEMIEKAQKNLPDAQFFLKSANEIENSYDIIFSNACLQWIPNHESLLPFLISHLNEGGVLAVQIPINLEEPLFKIISEVTHEEKWQFEQSLFEKNKVLAPEEYFDILSESAKSFDIWETVYYHALPDHTALVDWVRSTRLRPFLNALDEEKQTEFLTEILEKAKSTYKITQSGEVILRFRRLFFTAKKCHCRT